MFSQRSDSEEFVATKKGVCLKVEQIDELIAALEIARQKAIERGLLSLGVTCSSMRHKARNRRWPALVDGDAQRRLRTD